jgi:hypothetical protein
MVHDRFEFDMPASAAVVFDAFHYHYWKAQWDSLVDATHVVGDAPCPFVGAVSENGGGGWLKGLSMRTEFVSYKRPLIAAATMQGQSIPFTRWAASMKHQAINDQQSLMIYTYTFEAGPRPIRWLLEPVVKLIFDFQTKKRFRRMQKFLSSRAHEVEEWQRSQCIQIKAL